MRRHVFALTGIILGTATVGVWATGSAGQAPQQVASGTDRPPAKVVLHNDAGRSIGWVWLSETGEGVRVRARLHGLEPGFHGFHVHATGVCDPDDPAGAFKSAGGHYDGDGEGHHGDDGVHGDDGEHNGHDGDMPSLYVAEDGTARLSFVTDRFTLDELLAGDGSAVMVHADADNFAHIPDRYTGGPGTHPDQDTLATGDAGDRFACGVLGGDNDSEQRAGLVTVTSDDGFFATVRRIRQDIETSDDLTLVSVVNHAAAARDVGLELRPTTLVVFGNAAVGTQLMQEARTFGVDLPQKLLVWRSEGVVNVTYNDPHYYADRHGVTGQDELIDDIEATLHKLATGA